MKDKILIVDDVEINRLILAEILKEEYEILEASNGKDALSLLASLDALPQAILLDIVMPEMDGFETIVHLKQEARTKNIPVLFITATDATETESRGLNYGAADYISKPFNPDVVKARTRNHIQLFNYAERLEKMVALKTAELTKTHEQMLEVMATIIETRSLESGLHIRRTSDLTKILLAQMATMPEFDDQLTPKEIDTIGKAVVMHDIGKVGIPDIILLKPERLTDEEYDVIKTHTSLGSKIIESISSEFTDDTLYLKRCHEICRFHHERWDGKGYPDSLREDDIPLAARILAVVDVYEALVSKRCYKNPFTPKEAAEIIKQGSGTQFDPHICEAFAQVQDRFEQLVLT